MLSDGGLDISELLEIAEDEGEDGAASDGKGNSVVAGGLKSIKYSYSRCTREKYMQGYKGNNPRFCRSRCLAVLLARFVYSERWLKQGRLNR